MAMAGRMLIGVFYVLMGLGLIKDFKLATGLMASKSIPVPGALLITTVVIWFVGGGALLGNYQVRFAVTIQVDHDHALRGGRGGVVVGDLDVVRDRLSGLHPIRPSGCPNADGQRGGVVLEAPVLVVQASMLRLVEPDHSGQPLRTMPSPCDPPPESGPRRAGGSPLRVRALISASWWISISTMSG